MKRWFDSTCALHGLLLVALLIFLLHLPCVASATQVVPFEGDATGILQDGSTLHLLTDLGCYIIGEDHTLLPCERGCGEDDTAFLIAGPEQTTWAALRVHRSLQVARWTPEEENLWTAQGTYSPQEFFGITYITATDGDTLYFSGLYPDEEGGNTYSTQWGLSSYNLSTGEERSLVCLKQNGLPFILDAEGMPVYPQLKSNQTLEIVQLNPANKQTRTLSTVSSFSDSTVEGFAASPDGGWYMITSSALYAIRENGRYERINYLPRHGELGRTCLPLYICPERNEAIFCCASGIINDQYIAEQALYFVSLTPEDTPTLTILGAGDDLYYYTDTILAFENAHPGVLVNMVDYQSDQHLAESLITRNDGFDIMFLRGQDGTLRSVLNKGYFVDLSDVEEIRAFVEKLYPLWREEITRGDAIGAMPLKVDGFRRLGYNEEMWAAYDLGDIPQTYDELFDLLENWMAEDALDGSLLSYHADPFSDLLDLLLEQNIARYERRDEKPDFQDETFLRLLTRLEGMRETMANYGHNAVQSNALLKNRLFSPIRGSGYFNWQGYQPLPLGFDSPEDRGESIQLTAVAINPYSRQADLAKEFLALLLDGMQTKDLSSYYSLVDDADSEGVESPSYQALKEIYQTSIDGFAAELAEYERNEDTNGTDYAKQMLEMAQANYDNNEANRYTITAEELVNYRQRVPFLTIEQENGLSFLYENADSAIQNFISGKLSARDLAKRLDQILQAWEQENQ